MTYIFYRIIPKFQSAALLARRDFLGKASSFIFIGEMARYFHGTPATLHEKFIERGTCTVYRIRPDEFPEDRPAGP
jgi:hypothetical protein